MFNNIAQNLSFFCFFFHILVTIGTLNIFFSVFGVASADMIFRKQIEFIQRLKVLVIGQLFLLISDVIFFVMIVDKHNSFNFNFLTFLIALEIFYFLSMFELSLHSKSLWRDQENQICGSTLPSYEEAIIMIDSRK